MCKALDRPWVGVRVCLLLSLFVYSFQFQRTKLFKPYLKKYTWLVNNRDENLCLVKSVQKLTDWARSSRAEIFKILHSVDMLVFKNTKWPTCVYILST